MKSRLPAVLLLLFLPIALLGQFQSALPGYHYQFPRDHFDHPDYQTEWWYYTGNLKSADGHQFGFELTFFRQGVHRDQSTSAVASNAGDWNLNDLYLAHLALSDLDGNRFYHSERVNRAGPGIAGATEQAGKVWNGNWQVQWNEGQQQLRAIADNFSLQFTMTSRKPPVIHGNSGISQKAAGEGHASHYISFTRLLTTGSIELNGKTYQVNGTSWMDHEFFTNGLESNESGWDWLSLQLVDNTELMLYRLRHKDGSVDPYSSGTYIDASGKSTYLALSDFTMQPTSQTYASPITRATYPVAWKVVVPSLGLDLDITTPLRSQELATSANGGLPYWEGAIRIRGTRTGNPASGVGYLEMTGYARPLSFGP
jgi:predicted secreted hydrolase